MINQRRLFTLFLLLSGLPAVGQQAPYENLVFEGAGMRGIAYSGVLKEMEQQDILDDIERVGGTSAGAITALMVSRGYNSEEIFTIISETRFQQFNDGRFLFVGGIARLNKRYGWYRGQRFSRWISQIIADKTGDPEITFADLRAAGFKDLHVTGASLTRQQLLVFSAETYPNMKVRDALRASMSIPLYFEALHIDSVGAVYREQNEAGSLDLIVDGGITGNYPIFLFDSIAYDSLGQGVRIANPHTIGVRIDSDAQIERDSADHELAPIPIDGLKDYMQAFYVMVFESLNRAPLIEEDWERSISVSARGISPRIKKMSREQLDTLIQSGEESTSRFLAAAR
ncbi:MAG: patatin-like phospholipase family protein [Lewinella sp.]